MARGLVSAWKQPIFFDYDFDMNRETYFEIVRRLYGAKFTVVATVADLGPSNRGLLTVLGITTHKMFVEHPCNPSLRIYFFADVPHLLKLIRNHYLDDGFLLPGEKYISKTGLEELLEASQSSDLTMTFKLTKHMLDVQGNERMRVPPAAKMFSNNVSRAVKVCGEKGFIKYSNYKELSYVLKLVNDWFDIHNSMAEFGRHEGVNAFTASEKQVKILDEMTELFKKIKIGKHECCLPFQNGIIISNESLKGLYEMVKEKFQVNFIITRNLDQDVLENFFGFIRSMGSLYTHPDALQFKYRLRLYLLSKHSDTVFSSNTNCEQTDEETVTISSQMFDAAFQDEPITAKEAGEENPSADIEVEFQDLPDDLSQLLDDFEEKQVN